VVRHGRVPTEATSAGASPDASGCDAFGCDGEVQEHVQRVVVEDPPWKALTRKGVGPDASMTGLFALSALRRTLCNAEHLVHAPSCTIAALFLGMATSKATN
jgi:hypothetical protein